jgi:hypothetical protein
MPKEQGQDAIGMHVRELLNDGLPVFKKITVACGIYPSAG